MSASIRDPKRWIDRSAVAAFGVAHGLASVRLAAALVTADRLPATLAGVAAGYLLADFVAGIVHWFADRHFDPETPVIGPMLIEPFRAHHADPLSITRHDFFEILGHNALVTLPVTLPLCFLEPAANAGEAFVLALALSATFFAVATNLFHAWAHAPKPPRIARALQASGLVLTPRRHARHHRAPFDQAYCVTSGWLNSLLDRTGFFERLDARIARHARRQPAAQETRSAR